ncbi:MAG: KilA-N domain-containing protein [Candidatus Gracilibacteria bacterium]|nr:KilA-N domain-containing protein [Candidatus Gracilibacteria bacterium]
MINRKVRVGDIQVAMNVTPGSEDYICITDMAKFKDSERTNYIIQNWMRIRSTIEFLSLWEQMNNTNFNSIDIDAFKSEAGSNSFSMTPKKWITSTNAIGIYSSSGRYGGTYAHKDIAFEFASWLSAEFKLFLITEFQRLKQEEIEKKELGWDLKRTLSKVNYGIHTDAVKENLIPEKVDGKKKGLIYATEADILNKALFGYTAKEWRDKNPELKGNVRDNSNATQLLCLANLEVLNAKLIGDGIDQADRLEILNQQAIKQMTLLSNNTSMKKLEGK